ncbi:MAG: hypothetical protein H0U18_09230 [Pyrinomonadaceae bacterium]|jgi:GAF domain-containing protein|nr:hypothetical protein [Pyrinomonadaceae bacterium]
MAKELADELWMRVRRQRTLAEVGRRALSGADLSTLMNETVSLVADILEVEYRKILELLPSGDRLFLEAGVGWREVVRSWTRF